MDRGDARSDREEVGVIARDARERWFRRRFALVALVSLLCGAAVSLGRPVGAATGRSAEVLPVATDLVDRVVDVHWHGFDPTRLDGTFAVTIYQCTAEPKSVLKDCNTALTFPLSASGNQQPGVTGSDGNGRAFVDIMTTARLPQLACSETRPCSLMLYEQTADGYDPNGLPPVRTMVPLTFRKSAADCPPVKRFDARIETEASSAPALYQWAADLCNGAHALTLNVTNTSSNQSRADFFNNNVDIAVSSLPPQAGEAGPKAPKFTVAPIDLTAIVIAYNLIDPVTSQPIRDLVLTPRLVARLISDSDVLDFFNDPEFKLLNPHHTFPYQGTDPGLRAELNADTWIVTNWLNSDHNARAFLDGKDPYKVGVEAEWDHVKYPTNVFEARSQNGVYFPRLGEEGVAERLFAQTKPADGVPSSPIQNGFFGVLDLPTADRFALPVAKLTTGVGKPVITLNPDSLAAGFKAMTTTPDGFHVEPGAPADPAAWPLTKVDHMMYPTSYVNTNVGVSVQRLLNYAIGAGQKTAPDGYAALPSALVAQTESAAAALTPQPVTTTTTSTPTTVPTTSTTTGPFTPGPLGTGFSSGPVGSSFNGSGGSTTPTTTPGASAPGGTGGATTSTAGSSVDAQFAAMKLPGAGDHLALPIIFSLALLALLACAADISGRRGRRWLRTVRARPKPSEALASEKPDS